MAAQVAGHEQKEPDDANIEEGCNGVVLPRFVDHKSIDNGKSPIIRAILEDVPNRHRHAAKFMNKEL
jgi:hypothetical protein